MYVMYGRASQVPRGGRSRHIFIQFIDTDRLKKALEFEELLCIICHNLVDNPVHHIELWMGFKACIEDWLTRDNSCPVDRKNLTPELLRPPPRIVRSVLARIEIRCSFLSRGCNNCEKYEVIKEHEEDCTFNPKWENKYVVYLKEKLAEKDWEVLELKAQLNQIKYR